MFSFSSNKPTVWAFIQSANNLGYYQGSFNCLKQIATQWGCYQSVEQTAPVFDTNHLSVILVPLQSKKQSPHCWLATDYQWLGLIYCRLRSPLVSFGWLVITGSASNMPIDEGKERQVPKTGCLKHQLCRKVGQLSEQLFSFSPPHPKLAYSSVVQVC